MNMDVFSAAMAMGIPVTYFGGGEGVTKFVPSSSAEGERLQEDGARVGEFQDLGDGFGCVVLDSAAAGDWLGRRRG